MNILHFPSVRIVGAPSSGATDDPRLEEGALDPPLSRPPPLRAMQDQPALHLLLTVTSLHHSALSAALALNPRACAVLDAFRDPAPVGVPANLWFGDDPGGDRPDSPITEM